MLASPLCLLPNTTKIPKLEWNLPFWIKAKMTLLSLPPLPGSSVVRTLWGGDLSYAVRLAGGFLPFLRTCPSMS